MLNDSMFSSKTEEWYTPGTFFEKVAIGLELDFTLDVAASAENTKAPKFFTKEDDGLVQDWRGHTIWMNPPYGRVIGQWVKKLHESTIVPAEDEATIEERAEAWNTVGVALIPARTDTKWWHDHVMKADELYLISGRLKFEGAETKSNAPFPSAVAVWYPRKVEADHNMLFPLKVRGMTKEGVVVR